MLQLPKHETRLPTCLSHLKTTYPHCYTLAQTAKPLISVWELLRRGQLQGPGREGELRPTRSHLAGEAVLATLAPQRPSPAPQWGCPHSDSSKCCFFLLGFSPTA